MSAKFIVISEDETPSVLSLIVETVSMTAIYGGNVDVVLMHGEGYKCIESGAAHVYSLGLEENYADEAALASVLASWLREQSPEVILANATVRIRALMPLIAARLGCGLTADCTALKLMEDGSLLQIRPALGGNVTASIVSVTRPQMATVRPGIFMPAMQSGGSVQTDPLLSMKRRENSSRKPEKLKFHLNQIIKCLAYNKTETYNTLTGAGIIVAGGAGIGSRAGFVLLERLATRLNGCVGASRSAVNLGYAPFSCQIGQTGQIVRPKIYLAIGISGAVQHLVGMNGADTVIAINSDRNAPVFDYADYGMTGDWRKITEQLLNYLA